MKKVGIYVRVSTKDQSTDMQIAEIRRYCEARGLEVVATFSDTMSGTKVKRPELDRLMAAAKRREIDTVIVWKLDRFGRSLKHLIMSIAEFESLGITFISLRDSLDFSTPAGRLQFQLLSAIAEFEACLIRERVSAGVTRAIESGKAWGRPIKINRARVGELRAQGLSTREIARALNCGKSAIQRIIAAVG